MTPITKQSLEELKQKARAAISGPWEHRTHGYHDYIFAPDSSDDGIIAEALFPHNADYVAAASPDVILDLIAQVEGLDAALKFYAEGKAMSDTGDLDSPTYNENVAIEAIESFGVK